MTTDPSMHLLHHRSIFIRQIRARPRLSLSLAFGIATGLLFPLALAPHLASRLLIAWNAGIWLYLLLVGVMIMRSSSERMHWRARVQDEARLVILSGVILTSLACLAAIVAELGVAKDTQGAIRVGHLTLAAATLVASWCFVHLTFALHYAHDYYIDLGQGGDGGLNFPGTREPHYLDFLYFSCVIGTSGQTADVSFCSSRMRRTGLVHCILAYIFNTTVLALTINIASGLF